MTDRCHCCGRQIDDPSLPAQTCLNCMATLSRPVVTGGPTAGQLLRAEFPVLEDAELGMEPVNGWDRDGTPIY